MQEYNIELYVYVQYVCVINVIDYACVCVLFLYPKKRHHFLKSLFSSSMGKYLNLFPCLFYFLPTLKQGKSFHKM